MKRLTIFLPQFMFDALQDLAKAMPGTSWQWHMRQAVLLYIKDDKTVEREG